MQKKIIDNFVPQTKFHPFRTVESRGEKETLGACRRQTRRMTDFPTCSDEGLDNVQY